MIKSRICDIVALRKAIKNCSAVYVAIMLGNMTWHAKISKGEANTIARDIARTWNGSTQELGVSAFAILYEDNELYIGDS